ncbi:MAG: hypothetical protein HF311_18265, partial [Ignavibacteria bacterium]|nr:hypothetical protein [Ignavibacteria bacterium]
CKSPNEPAPASSEYFPLAVGNKWYYHTNGISDTSSINVVREVTGQKSIDNKTYYEVVSTQLASGIKDTAFLRMSDKILFAHMGKGENIIADFSLNLNDKAYWEKDLKVSKKNGDIMAFESIPQLIDNGYGVTYQKGVGMTYSFLNGFAYEYTKLVKSEIK